MILHIQTRALGELWENDDMLHIDNNYVMHLHK